MIRVIGILAIVIIAALALVVTTGCETVFKGIKHMQSGIVGLNRVVILYSEDGDTIRVWRGQFMIETEGSSASWVEHGRETKISGTFVIEELP